MTVPAVIFASHQPQSNSYLLDIRAVLSARCQCNKKRPRLLGTTGPLRTSLDGKDVARR